MEFEQPALRFPKTGDLIHIGFRYPTRVLGLILKIESKDIDAQYLSVLHKITYYSFKRKTVVKFAPPTLDSCDSFSNFQILARVELNESIDN